MDFIAILLIAVGLAMDAFAVSLCKGLALRKVTLCNMFIAGLWFGGFQALMPIIGFYLGVSFYDLISAYDHWVAFFLLFLIGANMVREGLFGEEEEVDADMGVKTMVLLAIATSIDALAIGISFAMTEDSIFLPALIIGVVTLVISMAGVKIGSLFGDRFGKKAEALGGIILIIIGLKVLLEGLGFI
ncbi:MAG: manganese efflux pump [Candidatus Methanomethylophilaceae archaeon]|nr:manganese efflux pump [Candidatus Methanomethylophilaceae archaeon]MBR6871556.1 manganese efflux pump [Candidatus Methanomethylophilaceae archaeon]